MATAVAVPSLSFALEPNQMSCLGIVTSSVLEHVS